MLSAQVVFQKQVISLESELLFFDESYNQYVAYLPDLHTDAEMLHFWLKPYEYAAYDLVLQFNTDVYFYIDHNLQGKFSEGWHSFSLDSLQKRYGCRAIFCSLYASKAQFLEKIFIGTFREATMQEKETLPNKSLLSDVRYRVILLVFVLLMGYALLRQLDLRLLRGYLQISKFFKLQRRIDNPLFIRPFTSTNILFLLNYTFLIGAFWYLLAYTAPLYENVFWKEVLLDNMVTWRFLGVAWLGALGGLLLKLLWINLFASLLGLSKVATIHFCEYVRISHFLYLPLTLWLMYLAIAIPHELDKWYIFFRNAVIIVWWVRFAALWYIINKAGEFRKLDFYSYLCVVELFPLLVFWKKLFF